MKNILLLMINTILIANVLFIPISYGFGINSEYLIQDEPSQFSGDYPRPIKNLKKLSKYFTYPEIAKIVGFEGFVIVEALINENGDVDSTLITMGQPNTGLDWAATDGIKQIKFVPAKLQGKPVSVWTRTIVSFKLKKHSITVGAFFPIEEKEIREKREWLARLEEEKIRNAEQEEMRREYEAREKQRAETELQIIMLHGISLFTKLEELKSQSEKWQIEDEMGGVLLIKAHIRGKEFQFMFQEEGGIMTLSGIIINSSGTIYDWNKKIEKHSKRLNRNFDEINEWPLVRTSMVAWIFINPNLKLTVTHMVQLNTKKQIIMESLIPN